MQKQLRFYEDCLIASRLHLIVNAHLYEFICFHSVLVKPHEITHAFIGNEINFISMLNEFNDLWFGNSIFL